MSEPAAQGRPLPAASETATPPGRRRRSRGARGGRNRRRPGREPGAGPAQGPPEAAEGEDLPPELPERRPDGASAPDVAEKALVPRPPRIGDTRPAPPGPSTRRGRRRRGGGAGAGPPGTDQAPAEDLSDASGGATGDERRGRERKGRPVGRYLMCVHVEPESTQIAVLEGRALIEHYVSRPQDDVNQIHGNIYLGRVQNVLPGMEAAFIDIGTPKNAVLYRGDIPYDAEDIEDGGPPRIEHILRPAQSLVCQVTKNPIGHKGARLTQEVSLPGRFAVLVPGSSAYGISKRLPEEERRRLRSILDEVKPAGHGLIVRTAAEGATRPELERDVARLVLQWERIEADSRGSSAPALLYREPDMAVRVIREEFNRSYRGVVIDEGRLFQGIRDYVSSITPELAYRVVHFDVDSEPLPLFELHHVHEQLHKALDRKVWLPSGGSLVIEHTEALTVIDVNTGRNVGRSSLEETVYRNNLEAAEEVARQLRLRDIGGIIVVDFIDMDVSQNRDDVMRAFRAALARDKTRTQVFDISNLGLVEMTRKRIGEGLIESMSEICPTCEGRGLILDRSLLPD